MFLCVFLVVFIAIFRCFTEILKEMRMKKVAPVAVKAENEAPELSQSSSAPKRKFSEISNGEKFVPIFSFFPSEFFCHFLLLLFVFVTFLCQFLCFLPVVFSVRLSNVL